MNSEREKGEDSSVPTANRRKKNNRKCQKRMPVVLTPTTDSSNNSDTKRKTNYKSKETRNTHSQETELIDEFNNKDVQNG
jgi:hypothetical protein